MRIFRTAGILIGLLGASAAFATANDLRSIAGMRQHYRVLIVFTPSLADARLASQRAIMAQLAVEAAKRDLLFVQADPMIVIGASDKGDKLRRRFRVPVMRYHALLIDKDGRVLREAVGPMDGGAILHAIDMTAGRRAEVRDAHTGHAAGGVRE
jgi:hypothetical protein